MKVMGLLQNQWARDPTAMLAMFARWPRRRLQLIAMMLAQSHSGRRLRAAFGEWMRQIVWENASPAVTGKSNGCPPPDIVHVNAALASIQPDVVMAFGVQAARAVRESDWSGAVITAPHPAARSGDVDGGLRAARAELEVVASIFAG